MNKIKNIIACLLVIMLTNNLIMPNALANSVNETIVVDGHTFNIATNTPDLVSYTASENGINYYVAMNKNTNDVVIKETKDSLFSKETVESYNVKIHSYDSEVINYTVTDNNLKTSNFKSENYSQIYEKIDKENSVDLKDGFLHGQVVVDLGIALIVLLAVIIILTIAVIAWTHDGIDYSYWADVVGYIKSLTGYDQKVYYYACIWNGHVLVGNAFTSLVDCTTYTLAMRNSSQFGVYCVKSGYANSLAYSTGTYYGAWPEEIHGPLPAFQYHTHAMKNSTQHFSEHIWYSK
ncbi:MAG: hypothetical protein K0R00_2032 [Herbinix sp.]|jgi:hypothetical protein|nr:hypothetical protein [Herbinix sp.]